MLARRTPVLLIALAGLALVPAAASANTERVSAPVPADGGASFLQVELRGKNKGKVGDVKVSVEASKAVRDQIGVLVETHKTAKRMTVAAFLVNPQDPAGRAAGFGTVVFKFKSGRQITVGDALRIADALATATDEDIDFACKKKKRGKRVIKDALGTFDDGGVAPKAVVNAIYRLLCGKELRAQDKAIFEAILIPLGDGGGGGDDGDDGGDGDGGDPCVDDPTAPGCDGGGDPGPQGQFGCNPFDGNPFEGVCVFSGPQFDALRLTGSGGNIFQNCFSEVANCQIPNAGQPNNFIIYIFNGPMTNSGDFFAQSNNVQYGDWDGLALEYSNDGGASFMPGGTFDPPPDPR